jgi:hypothetical protein
MPKTCCTHLSDADRETLNLGLYPHLSWRTGRGGRLRWGSGMVSNIFDELGPIPVQVALNLALLTLATCHNEDARLLKLRVFETDKE